MSVTVVVGAQWGDEGKGKLVDFLSKDVDIISRYQGGDNAGHTVVNPFGSFKLHVIPCGVFYKNCTSVIGTGMVVNPDVLLEEVSEIEKQYGKIDNIRISGKTIILMPYHIELDSLKEQVKDKNTIGTTKRGIGPAYSDRALRSALRFEDLADLEYVKERISSALPKINSQIAYYGGRTFSVEELYEKCVYWKEKLDGMIINTVSYFNKALKENKSILFEGQLGAMKDIDHGIYPFVTSSHPTAAYAAVSAGISPKKIDKIIGIMKAFSSAVGNGPFPTEMSDEDAEAYRGTGANIDDEFGARTGRSRRIGYSDLFVVKYAAMLNGFTDLAVSKIDKLDNIKEIKVCTGYKLNGKIIDYMPTSKELYKVEPIYVTLPGWMEDTTKIRKIEDLPENCKKYLKLIEEVTETPVTFVGVGASRDDFAL